MAVPALTYRAKLATFLLDAGPRGGCSHEEAGWRERCGDDGGGNGRRNRGLAPKDFEARFPKDKRLWRGVTNPAAAAASRAGTLGDGDFGQGIYFAEAIGHAQGYASRGGDDGVVLRAAIAPGARVRKLPDRVFMRGPDAIDTWAVKNKVDVVDAEGYVIVRNPKALVWDSHDYTSRESVIKDHEAQGYILPEGYEAEIERLKTLSVGPRGGCSHEEAGWRERCGHEEALDRAAASVGREGRGRSSDETLVDDIDNASGPADVKQALDKAGATALETAGVTFPNVYVTPNHIVEWDGEDEYASVSDKQEWVNNADVSDYYPDYEDQQNRDFWESGGEVYHATTEENAEAIEQDGIEARNQTRGLSNRSTGSAVFTTTDLEETAMGSYGDEVFAIDIGAMQRDGLTPYTSQEPDVVEAELRGALAHAVDLEHYEAEVESGMSPNTVAIHGHIPAKYVRRVAGKNLSDQFNLEFGPRGGCSHEEAGWRERCGEGGRGTDASGQHGKGGTRPTKASKVPVQANPSPESFIEARDKSTQPGYLAPLTPAELQDHTLFMSPDGTVGAALAPDGDMGNLFNNGGPKGAARELMLEMIANGGKTGDAYEGHLTKLYAQFGVQETGRMKFDLSKAPAGWNVERDDHPDVVFLAKTEDVGDADAIRARLADKSKWLAPKRTDHYYDGTEWDRAKADARTRADARRTRPDAMVRTDRGAGVDEEALAASVKRSPDVGRGLGPYRDTLNQFLLDVGPRGGCSHEDAGWRERCGDEGGAEGGAKHTKRGQEIVDHIVDSGVGSDHVNAMYSDDPNDAIATNFDMDTVRDEDIAYARAKIARVSQEMLRKKHGETLTVYRGTTGTEGKSPTTSVTLRPLTAKFHAEMARQRGRGGEVKKYTIKVDDVLGYSEAVGKGTFAEEEIIVKAETLSLSDPYTLDVGPRGGCSHEEAGWRERCGGESAQGDRAEKSDTGGRSGRGESVSPPAAGVKGRPAPNPKVAQVASAYNAAHGLPPVEHGYREVDDLKAKAIADAYDAMPDDDSDNPVVREAYAALNREVSDQWDAITASGMTLEPWEGEGQPYQNSTEMAEDVRSNGHMYFFRGGNAHPLGGERDESGLTATDKFRAVHDYFGHAAGGYGFGPRGEENAWISHSQMLSPNARRAMTAVTRGQNSWVNFGDQNYNADGTHKNIPLAARPFAKQKAALLPDEFVRLPGEDAVGVLTPTMREIVETVEAGRATNPLDIAANPRDTIRSYRAKLAAFLLDVGPRGGCSHEEAGWRERCGGENGNGHHNPKSLEHKAWVAGTKAVDTKGDPLTVYHTTTEDFSEFSREKFGKSGFAGLSGLTGVFFTTRKDFGYGPKRYAAQLKVANPLHINAKEAKGEPYRAAREQLTEKHDAVAIQWGDGSTEWIVFDPMQARIVGEVEQAANLSDAFDLVGPRGGCSHEEAGWRERCGDEGGANGGRGKVPPKGVFVTRRGNFDFQQLGNRRFMFNPRTDHFVFGGEDSTGMSHAEEFAEAKATAKQGATVPPLYDEYLKGWLDGRKGGEDEDPNGSVEIYSESGQYLPGGGEGSESNDAALFDAVAKVVEGFIDAGATAETRIKSLDRLFPRHSDDESLGEAFPSMFRPTKSLAAFMLDLGPRGGCSHEEAGWRERCGGERGGNGRGKEGGTSSKQFKKWFKDSAVVDDDGEPLTVYHGTTHNIEQFKEAGSEGLNPEADWGSGVYFTSEPEDASENYAGEGPDLTSRIEQRAEEIESEMERAADEDDQLGGIGRTYVTEVDEHGNEYDRLVEGDRRKAAMEQARKELAGQSASIIPAYISMQRPFVVGDANGSSSARETRLEMEYEYDDPDDPDSDIVGQKGALVDFAEALRDEAAQFDDADVDDLLQTLSETDYLTASQLDKLVRGDEKFNYATDDKGRLVGHEIYRRALAKIGFDGVVDRTVNEKFGTDRKFGKTMAGMNPDTTHFIAFRPTQIKSAIGNVAFDPTNPSLVLSSRELALLLDVGPRGGCSHEEAGWRERCGGEGKGTREKASKTGSKRKVPKVIVNGDPIGLAEEARKAGSFEEFAHDFSIDTKHGLYWHVTKDPNFTIDPTKGPRDMSTMAESDAPDAGALMITSDLETWVEYYNTDPQTDEQVVKRPYVAMIDMGEVPRHEYRQSKRGFGNEFYISDARPAKVLAVLPVETALKVDAKHNAALPQSDEELRAFYDRAVAKKLAHRDKLTFLLDLGPRGGCSHEEAGWRERCGGESGGGREHTPRSSHADNPRVFNTPDDVGTYESWVDGTRWAWKDKETGKPSGWLLTGEPVKREDLPEELYHVTTAAPAVLESGVLLGQRSDAGLGGGQADGVSFTTSKEDARVIQRELVRAVKIARGDDTGIEAIARYAREDEKEAGLPKGTLANAVLFAKDQWDGNEHSREHPFRDGEYHQDETLPPAELEKNRRSSTKDALNAYLQIRGHQPVEILKNPILFGRQEQLAKIDPADVQTLTVPTKNIPKTALITTGSDKFLHEVRAYSDVPSANTTAQTLAYRDKLDRFLLDFGPRGGCSHEEAGWRERCGEGGSGKEPRRFKGDEGFDWHEKGPVAEWAVGLPYADAKAIQGYASFDYGDINRQLRGQFTPNIIDEYVRPATPEEIASHVGLWGKRAPSDYDPDDPTNQVADGRIVHNVFTKDPEGNEVEWSIQRAVPDLAYVARIEAQAATINTAIRERGYALPEPMEVNRAAYLPGMSYDELKAMEGGVIEEKGFTSTMVGDPNRRLDGYVLHAKDESIYKRYSDKEPHGVIERHQNEEGVAMRIKIVLPEGTKVAAVEPVRRLGYDFPRIPDPAPRPEGVNEEYWNMPDYSAKPEVDRGQLESKNHRSEAEVLLGSGAQFRIVSVTRAEPIRHFDPMLKPVEVIDVTMEYVGGGASEGASAAVPAEEAA